MESLVLTPPAGDALAEAHIAGDTVLRQALQVHSLTNRRLPPDTLPQAPVTLAYRKGRLDAATAILLALARRTARDETWPDARPISPVAA